MEDLLGTCLFWPFENQFLHFRIMYGWDNFGYTFQLRNNSSKSIYSTWKQMDTTTMQALHTFMPEKSKNTKRIYPWNSDSIVAIAVASRQATSLTLSPPSGPRNGSFSSISQITWYCWWLERSNQWVANYSWFDNGDKDRVY